VARFREYNAKLISLKNMQRVTKTMKMVSATKLHRAQDARRRADQFVKALQTIADRVAHSADTTANPLLRPRSEVRNVLLLLITSDKGLCGSFNLNLIKKANAWIREHKPKVKNLRVSFCGQQGYRYFKDKVEVRTYYEGATAHPDFAQALKIGRDTLTAFLDHKYDEIYIAYNINHSPLSQTPTVERILPCTFESSQKSSAPSRLDYLYEPEETALLDAILEKMFFNRIFSALLENAAGEHGARMTAMDSATTNIDKLRDQYTLLRNRARQGAITNELVEIVAGSEALK
jgi:F-type H+-transporting ATPase subunit gamma